METGTKYKLYELSSTVMKRLLIGLTLLSTSTLFAQYECNTLDSVAYTNPNFDSLDVENYAFASVDGNELRTHSSIIKNNYDGSTTTISLDSNYSDRLDVSTFNKTFFYERENGQCSFFECLFKTENIIQGYSIAEVSISRSTGKLIIAEKYLESIQKELSQIEILSKSKNLKPRRTLIYSDCEKV